MRLIEALSAAALFSTLGAAAPVAKSEKRTEFAPWYRATNILPVSDDKRSVDKRTEFSPWYRATNILPASDDKRDIQAPEEKRTEFAPWYRATNILPASDDK
ncbi:hypothetical protein PMIN03_007071 [Paraphaeosphaeria minitans]